MKLLVTGTRHELTVSQESVVRGTLYNIHAATPITLLIDGAAAGVDTACHQWAVDNQVPTKRFHADWGLGKKAGPIRNGRMLDEKPDLLIAFPGGIGTANCVKQARGRGFKVLEVAW